MGFSGLKNSIWLGTEVKIMATAEEIIVSGENFIERRIFLIPEQDDIDQMNAQAYGRGYKCGWVCGLLMGSAIIAFAALSVWLVMR
jgi:hypothetical protein